MGVEIKHGDKRALDFRTGIDLQTATSVTLTARSIALGSTTVPLTSTVVDALTGHVRHVTDGTLPVGGYYAQIVATFADGSEATFPSALEAEEFEITPRLGA